jgi:hypothetical protein
MPSVTLRSPQVRHEEHAHTGLFNQGAEQCHRVVDETALVTISKTTNNNRKVVENNPATAAAFSKKADP